MYPSTTLACGRWLFLVADHLHHGSLHSVPPCGPAGRTTICRCYWHGVTTARCKWPPEPAHGSRATAKSRGTATLISASTTSCPSMPKSICRSPTSPIRSRQWSVTRSGTCLLASRVGFNPESTSESHAQHRLRNLHGPAWAVAVAAKAAKSRRKRRRPGGRGVGHRCG